MVLCVCMCIEECKSGGGSAAIARVLQEHCSLVRPSGKDATSVSLFPSSSSSPCLLCHSSFDAEMV